MRKKLTYATMLSTIAILNFIYLGSSQYQNSSAAEITSTTQSNPITHIQTKAQVNLFRNALDKLGATSPEQVISIWASGEKSRNGVYHYAVACNELKEKLIKEWGQPEDGYWIIGGSSPMLDNYEVVYNKQLSDSEYEVKIKFYWITSGGPSAPTETTLKIVKRDDIWCVKEAK